MAVRRLGITRQALVVGLLAGMVYGVMEMVIEAVVGRGFWSPLRYIASVFTLGTNTDPGFALFPVLIGLMGHMMNSLIFGLIFALWISRITREPGSLALIGMVYAALIFVGMWFVVLPLIDPAMKLVNPIGFFFSHLAYGLVLGVGTAWARSSAALRAVPA